MRRPTPGRNHGLFPFFLCGGFHSKENWSWQDPVFPCNLFKTLHVFGYLVISENYVKIKLLLTDTWHVLFQSFVFDFVWFSTAVLHLCKDFYAFTSKVLNTLRQHIWCSHFFSNDCKKKKKKANGGIKDCVFSLRVVHILQPMGRQFLPEQAQLVWSADNYSTLPLFLKCWVIPFFSLSPQTIYIHIKNMAIIACLFQYSEFGYSA